MANKKPTKKEAKEVSCKVGVHRFEATVDPRYWKCYRCPLVIVREVPETK